MEQHSINPAQSPCWHLSWAAPSLQPNPHTQFCFQLLPHRSTHTHTHTCIINTRTRGLSFLTLLVRQADATQHSTGKNSEIKEMPTCNFRLSVRREWPFASMWIPVQPWNLNPEKPAVGFFPNLFWEALQDFSKLPNEEHCCLIPYSSRVSYQLCGGDPLLTWSPQVHHF